MKNKEEEVLSRFWPNERASKEIENIKKLSDTPKKIRNSQKMHKLNPKHQSHIYRDLNLLRDYKN
jgi:hypothetical protein